MAQQNAYVGEMAQTMYELSSDRDTREYLHRAEEYRLYDEAMRMRSKQNEAYAEAMKKQADESKRQADESKRQADESKKQLLEAQEDIAIKDSEIERLRRILEQNHIAA